LGGAIGAKTVRTVLPKANEKTACRVTYDFVTLRSVIATE
jgi:hypothetical protein